jgi:hypothetical protein
VLPATQDLVGAELQLVERPHREAALRSVLDPLQADYDYIVVDCPPSLGLLTLNVLAGANTVLIPIQCEYYGLEGISQLLNTVRLVQQNFNPGLAISGVLLTMYDARLNLCRQVAEDAKEYFGAKMFVTPIPRNVRLAEAPSFGKPILLYDVQSVGAKSYLAVAQELIRRLEGTPPERPRAVSVQPQDSVAALEAAALAASAQAAAKESSQTDNPDERASVEAASDNADTIAGSPNISGSENDTSNHPVNDGESDLLPSEQRASDQRASDQRASDQRASDQRVSGELASPETASNGAASAQGSSEPIVTERAAAESPDESPVALHAAEAIASDGLSAGDRAAQIGDASAPDVGSRESQSHEPEVTT